MELQTEALSVDGPGERPSQEKWNLHLEKVVGSCVSQQPHDGILNSGSTL